MATYSVFVEGPIDSMGLPELANAMSQRYGLPAPELVTRLQRGRFRVKSNLDASTAERYRRDLEKIGARVVVEDTALSPTTPAVGLPIQAALGSTLPGPMQGRAPALSLPPIVAQQAAEAPATKDPRTFTILGPQHTREPGRAATSSEAPPVAGTGSSPPLDEAAVRREVIRAGITSNEPARGRRPGTVSPSDVSNRVVRPSTSPNDASSSVRRPGTSSSAPQQIREVVRPGRVSTPQGLREPAPSARPSTASTPQGFREVMRPGSVSASPDVFRTGAQPTVPPTGRSGSPSVLPPRDPAQPSAPPPSVLPPRSAAPSISPQSALPPREASPSMPPPANGLAAAAGQAARPASPQLASGLAAAYTPASGLADLGALSESSFSLASLDGQDDVPVAALPPDAPAAVVNIKAKASDVSRAKPSPSKPMDLFAPPDAGDQELKVELAVEEIAERAAKRASIPPATQQLTAAASQLPSQRFGMAQPVALPAPPSEGGTVAVSKPFSREQFAIGVVLALVIGFVPAHFVASTREKTAFAAIDSQVEALQAGADTAESYALLDGARLKLRNEKESTRSSLALQSMLIWAVVSAGVGFAFFKLRKPS